MSPEPIIRPMTRPEFDTLVEWAAGEGWNPGLDDAEVFWRTDPAGFVAAELEGRLIGGGSIVAYGRRFGFMGFFIVRPEHRGAGHGGRLWTARRDRLRERLDDDGSIGMDGVFDMEPYYARGGFRLHCRDLRLEGVGRAAEPAPGIVDLSTIDFEAVEAYDRAHFPAPRPEFLAAWIDRPGGAALGALAGGRLVGYGVLRPCRRGFKIGPLFADDAAAAGALFDALAGRVVGEAVFLDVPENNPAALELAAARGLTEVFGCARMYLGPAPDLPEHEIFGVTTFELG